VKTKGDDFTSPEAAVSEASSPASLKVGRLVDGSTPASLTVDFDGNSFGPIKARTTVRLDEMGIRQAVAIRQGVLLAFENDDPRLPIVTGLLVPEPGAALLASLLHGPETPVSEAPADARDARLEGGRVVIEGDAEVVLRCGDASITLRRDGKLILRGAYVETTAAGVNRIRGGSVKIN
jgi:hypothetical protein